MYNAQTNEIYFPHLIPGNVLGNKEHTFNNVNAGIFPIEKFNLVRNRFFGGNVKNLGLIKEYGFYACPHYLKVKVIVGFFIDDPSQITELGKKLLQEKYPTATIVWEKITSAPHREMTPEEIEKKKEMIKEVVKNGGNAQEVSMATADELEGLLKAQASGSTGKQIEVTDSTTSKDRVPVVVKHLGNKR
jgi:hypothetical protein